MDAGGQNKITADKPVVYWSIEIDGREVIGHWDILPQITWKGTWNGTRIFMMAWYIGDYGR